jgi:hypothetical protein
LVVTASLLDIGANWLITAAALAAVQRASSRPVCESVAVVGHFAAACRFLLAARLDLEFLLFVRNSRKDVQTGLIVQRASAVLTQSTATFFA